MNLSTAAKALPIYIVFFLLLSACSGPGGGNSNSTSTGAQTSGEFPFEISEPTTYQAKIVMTAGGVERTSFIARSGELRRTDHRLGTPLQLTLISGERETIIFPAMSIYAERESGSPGEHLGMSEITSWLLSQRSFAEFESLGKEGGLDKYSVRIDRRDGSEAIVFYDPELKMPVRHEFYSISGSERTIHLKTELREVKLEAEPSLFALPPDLKKVTEQELYRQLQMAMAREANPQQ